MGTFGRRLIPVAVGATIGALVVAAVGIAQEDRPVKKGPATPVVVVGSEPVSVSGEVSATLDEPVEVEASGDGLAVDVASLESRLDELTAAVEASSPEPQGELISWPARFVLGNDNAAYFGLVDPLNVQGTGAPPDVQGEVLIQSVTINSVDDELEIVLWRDGSRVYDVANSFGDNLGRAHFTYPAPIEADAITANCNNELEDCNVEVSWAGRLAPDS